MFYASIVLAVDRGKLSFVCVCVFLLYTLFLSRDVETNYA